MEIKFLIINIISKIIFFLLFLVVIWFVIRGDDMKYLGKRKKDDN